MLNVALLGFGRIGQMHAENINNHNKLNLLYICEKDSKLAKKAKLKFKCKVVKNYKTLFEDNMVDIIFISSSTPTHINFIKLGVRNNKTVFCEKPLDLNLDKIKDAYKIIKKKKYKIQMGFNRRFDPGHHSIILSLKNNKIGSLEKIIITSRDPSPPPLAYLKISGGIFKDMMIHDFDLCRYYLDKDQINEISSFATRFKNMYKKINDYELATVTMKSKKGVLCIINNSRHCSFGYDQRVELFGSKGMLISNNKKVTEAEFYNSKNTNSKNLFLNFFIERYNEAYKIQLDELVKLAEKNIISRSSFSDGYEALKLAEAAYKSLKQKKTVFIK